MRKLMISRFRFGFGALVLSFFLLGMAASVEAQTRRTPAGLGNRLISLDVSEITLEAIDLRNQTARLNVGLDVSNALVPLSLKDFEYSLNLYGAPTITGRHAGTMRIGGRTPSRINLPVEVHLRSIPNTLWQAFSNRGNIRYELDTGFTLPLFVFEQRLNQSFSGEVPLRSVVDAATIMRAQRDTTGGLRDIFGW